MMYKYSNIQNLVNKLTENEALRTFYTLLLMIENEEEKQRIDTRFWAAFADLSEIEQMPMKIDFKEAVKKLPLMTDDLLHRVKDYRTSLSAKQAA